MSRNRSLLGAAVLVAVLVLGLSAAAAAQYMPEQPAQDDFGRPGGYLSLGAGGANAMFTDPYGALSDELSQAILIGLRAGARANRFVALDLSFDYSVRGFEYEFAGSAASFEARSLTGFGNLKLYPLSGRIQPFVMGGVGFLLGALDCVDTGGNAVSCTTIGLSDQDIAFAGRAGGGLDLYLTRNFALTGEIAYVIPAGVFSELNYLQYGGYVTVRF